MGAINCLFSILVVWTISQHSVDGRYVDMDDFLAMAQEMIEIKAERRDFNDRITKLETQLRDGEVKISLVEEKLRVTETKLSITEETVRTVEEKLTDALTRIAELENADTGHQEETEAPVIESGDGHPGIHVDGDRSAETRTHAKRGNSIRRRSSGGNNPQHHITRRSITHTAFSAFLETSLNNLGHQNTIHFDRLALNEGNGYIPHTGSFVCPYSGVYVFQSAVVSANHDRVNTEIVKNGKMLARMYGSSESTSAGGFDQGFNSVITLCNQGEHVWVRIVESYGTAVHGQSFTSFSGYQLW